MDWQAVFNVIAGAALTAVGWFCKTVYTAVKSLEVDLSAHKVKSAEMYITRAAVEKLEDSHRESLARLERKLDDGFNRIFDKLDTKADRKAGA